MAQGTRIVGGGGGWHGGSAISTMHIINSPWLWIIYDRPLVASVLVRAVNLEFFLNVTRCAAHVKWRETVMRNKKKC